MTNFNNPNFRDRPTPAAQPASDLADGLTQRPAVRNQATYQDGYWQGRASEQRNLAQQRANEEEGVASGVIFGILLASLLGLGVGTYLYLTGQNRTPVVTPTQVNPSPAPAQSPIVQERIIERDRVVPVPQPAPANPPQVNITLPENTPAPPETRVPQPSPQSAETVPGNQ